MFKNLGNAQPAQQEYGYEQDYSYGGQEEEPDAQNQAMLDKMNKAYQWATENPDDPRSKGILKKLGL